MLGLLSSYSLVEIITFVIILAIGIKEFLEYRDWGVDRMNKRIKRDVQKSKEKDDMEERLKKYDEDIAALKEQNKIISNNIQLLLDSDRDDIKAWITSQHHYFCYELKYIDNFSRDCLEKRYGHYVEEGGNSFIEAFMRELRALPDSPPTDN
jgi:hypothetical protein